VLDLLDRPDAVALCRAFLAPEPASVPNRFP